MLKIESKKTILNIVFYLFLTIVICIPLTLFIKKTLHPQTLFLLSRIKIWFALLLLYFYCIKIEKEKFLLWNEKKYGIGFYLASLFLIFATLIGILMVIGIILKLTGTIQQSDAINKIVSVLKKNNLLLFFTCLTAGITEELIFRGYLLPRLERVFKNIIIPILISSLLFGLMHFGYGTLVQVVGPFFIGLIFAIHYYKFRNIKIVIICHFLWDFMFLLIKSKYS